MSFDPIPTSNLDQDTDSPKLAREDLLNLVQQFNSLLAGDARLLFTVEPLIVPVISGSLSFVGVSSDIRVLRYSQDETSLWALSKVDVDCTSTLVGTTLTIIGLSKDSGYVVVNATRAGQPTLARRLLVTRNEASASVVAVDPTPPPTVTGVAVAGGIDTLYVSWITPSYPQGRGNAQTNVYGATYTGSSPPVFSDVSVKRIATAIGFQSFIPIPTEPATKWVIWVKFQSRDGYESVIPAPSAASGATAETSLDITKLLESLAGRITSSELNSALSSEIALISAPSSVSNSVNQRLASLQSSVVANSATSFEPFLFWDFNGTLEGWTATNASVTSSSTYATITSSSTDPILAGPGGLSVDGSLYDKVRARIRRLAGTGWDGSVYYKTSTGAAHNFSTSYFANNSNNPALNTWITVEWDMSALAAGGNDWITNTILDIRLDLGNSPSDVFQVDWVSIGRVGVGASYAALQLEGSTRATTDGYLGSQFFLRTTLASDGRTVTGGFGIAGTSAPGQGPTIDFGVMANSFWIGAPSGSGVASSVPFTVQTTDIVDVSTGQLQPKGVYIDSAYIKNLSALWGRFGTLIANSIQATSISTDQINLGSGVVGTILRSANFVSNVSGWMLNPTGAAQFPATYILGQLTASQINANGLSIRDNSGALILDANTGNYLGNVTGTVGGVSVASLVTSANNFNASNDRNGSAISAVTFANDGTAVDHVINTDGSVDLTVEWNWGGTNGDIDGFLFYVYSSASSSAYSIGTNPAEEAVYTLPAAKRAMFFSGLPANKYYSFGIRAYRKVDPDINASGMVLSPLSQPSFAGENPYQPSSSVAFAGNISGTINGVSAVTLTSQAYDGSAAYVYRPNLLPNGGFEQGLAGLTGTASFNIYDSALWGRHLLSTTVTGTGSVSWPLVTIAGGQWYTIHGDAALFATSGGVYFDILFFDNTGTLLLDGPQNLKNAPFDFSSDDSTRRQMAVEVQAPALAVSAVARFVWFNLVGTAAVGCRLVKLERGRLPYTPYSADTSFIQTSSAVVDPNTGLNSRILNSGTQTLQAVLRSSVVAAPNGFVAGSLAWDSSGTRTSGLGVAITPKGLVAHNGTNTTLSLEATSGNVYARGLSVVNDAGQVILSAIGNAVAPWVQSLGTVGADGISLTESADPTNNVAQLRSLKASTGISLSVANGVISIAAGQSGDVIYLSSDFSQSSAAQLTPVPGMQFSLETNTSYRVHGVLRVKSPSEAVGVRVGAETPFSATTGGADTTFSAEAQTSYNASSRLSYFALNGGGGAAFFDSSWAAAASAPTTFDPNSWSLTRFECIINTGSVTGGFRLLAGTSLNGSIITVGKGSYMKIEKLSLAVTGTTYTYSGLPVTAPSYSSSFYNPVGGARSTTSITLKMNGTFTVIRTGASTITANWLVAGNAQNLEIKFVVSGTSGTFGVTRLNGAPEFSSLANDLTYSISSISRLYQDGSITGSSTVQIRSRDKFTGVETVLSTVTLSATAESEITYPGYLPP